ncbi:MAG: choice-of-anchor A family protein [Actinomycetota bacterium]
MGFTDNREASSTTNSGRAGWRRAIRWPIAGALVWAQCFIPSTAAHAAAFPAGFGDCVPGNCPTPYPALLTNGPVTFRDDAVNVFAGGNYTVSGTSAEAEGRVVVLGDFTLNKNAPPTSQIYNVGEAGVGSRVTPSNGSDFLTVGGT